MAMRSLTKILSNRYLLLGLRLVLGAVFVWAAWHKIADPGGFARDIYNYRMLPEETINLMAIIMPWLELVCGIFIIIGALVRGSAALIGLMLLVFIIAISSALARGLDISCGCFKVGDGGRLVGLETLIEDILMVAAVVVILAFGGRSLSRRA